jgi:hypothetical protein
LRTRVEAFEVASVGKLSFESAFLRSLEGSIRRRERYLAALASGDPAVEESAELANELANFLNLQGMMIAHLAMDPDTSDELIAAAPHAGQRVPAWMELHVFGARPGALRLFTLGCAQILAEQRAALERIVDDQVDDPEPIRAILAEHPVPSGDDGESAEELMALSAAAFQANFQGSLAIARDLDEWIEEELAEE